MHCHACGHDQPTGRFCGHCGALLDGGDATERSPDAPPDRRTGWWVVAILAVGLVVSAALIGIGGDADVEGDVAVPTDAPSPTAPTTTTSSPTPRPSPPAGPVLDARTGTTLLFDDGQSGLVALDLDTGRRAEVELPGQRPGDQPYRLIRHGLELVVGWDGVVVTVPGQDDVSRELGDEATIALPAAEPSRVWLVTWEGGRIGAGVPTWELVDMAGTVHHRTSGPAGLDPVRGVPGGLAVRDATGSLLVHEVATGGLVDGVGAEGAVIGDVAADRVAWCEDPCEDMHVTGPDGDVTIDAPDVEVFVSGPGAIRLSPRGTHVATHARVSVGDGVDLRVHVHDAATGDLVTSAQVPLGGVRMAWSDDGSQLFYTVRFGETTAEGPHVVGRLTEDGVRTADLGPYGVPSGAFVTYPAEAAAGWF